MLGYRELYYQVAEDSGLRPEIPKDCPPLVEAMMVECWHGLPSLRPTFEGLDIRMGVVDLTKFTDAVLESVRRKQECFFAFFALLYSDITCMIEFF